MDADIIDGFVKKGIEKVSGSNNWSGHDRGTTIGASEIGACARRIVYDKHGAAADPDFSQDWGAAERGHAIEDWYVSRMREGLPTDVFLRIAGEEQKTLVRGAQSATPDGLLVFQGNEPAYIYLEIKSVDPRLYDVMTQAKSQHVFQTIQGMDLVRENLKIPVARAIIVYINASFVSQRRYFEVAFDEKLAKNLRTRAEDMLFGKWSVETPPSAEGKMEGGKECDYCPFYKKCTAHDVGCLPDQVRPLNDIPSETVAKARELVVQQRTLRTRGEEIETSKKSVEAELNDLLSSLGTKSIKAPWGSVSVFAGSSPPQFDTAKMQEDGIDLDKYRKPGTRSTRMSITFKE